jgi:ribonuclease P protein component
MKRRYRLAESSRFRRVRQEGTSYAHPLLVLMCMPNQRAASRCGVAVSKRAAGNAVDRNRAKRRIREAIRLQWDAIEPGWDMVWIARPGVNEAEFSTLQEAATRLLRRARLLAAPGVTKAAPPPVPRGADTPSEPA